jgi:3-oxoacyl-[acyl-carrier-protein] synthase-3
MTTQIKVSEGARYARILSVGGYRPARVVPNSEIVDKIDSCDEWIRDRSGIITRHFAAPTRPWSTWAPPRPARRSPMPASRATRSARRRRDRDRTPIRRPSARADIAHRLGAASAGAFDLSAACAGFCYGVALANDIIRGGTARYVVVIGVESSATSSIRPTAESAFIFGDGAGAVVVGPSDVPAIGPTIWGFRRLGARRDHQQALVGPDAERPRARLAVAHHAGPEGVPVGGLADGAGAAQALEAAGVDPGDLDAFIPHQANMRITDAMIKALKLPAHVPSHATSR